SGRDDGSRGTTRHEITFVCQHLIGHFDCATRQGQLTGEVAHGQHAVSRTEFARSNRLPIAPIQLQIERYALFLARSEVLQVHIECPIKLVNSCTYLLGHDFPTVLSMQQGSSPEENLHEYPKTFALSHTLSRGLSRARCYESSAGEKQSRYGADPACMAANVADQWLCFLPGNACASPARRQRSRCQDRQLGGMARE